MNRQAADDKKRLLRVTSGNIRQNHLYISGDLDFFPSDAIGAPRKAANGDGNEIEIILDGLNETVRTDIGVSPGAGKPRGFFRGRAWVRRFLEHHGVGAGDELALEKLNARKYRLSVQRTNGNGNHEPLRAAEFFAGIGLVRMALDRQNWSVVFANDIDPDKAKMYRDNWPKDDHLVVGDIHDLKAKDIPSCELFTASFPCNDLSIAGRREGLRGKESSAFWGLVDIIRKMGKRRPPLVMLENVVGFLMSRGGQDLKQALQALNELGYTVDAMILNAVHWVPQSRQRLFVIAKLDNGTGGQTLPTTCSARPSALTAFIAAHQEIHWDLRELPPLPKPTRQLVDIVEALADDDPHWWDDKRSKYFMNQMSPRHAEDAAQMISGESFTYATAFRRVRNEKSMAELRTDGIAGCLRTPRGGSGRQILFKAGHGKYQVRLLTARECARLQGVPNSYIIDVPLNQALFGFGDAVCVPAVEWIVKHYLTKVVVECERTSPQ